MAVGLGLGVWFGGGAAVVGGADGGAIDGSGPPFGPCVAGSVTGAAGFGAWVTGAGGAAWVPVGSGVGSVTGAVSCCWGGAIAEVVACDEADAGLRATDAGGAVVPAADVLAATDAPASWNRTGGGGAACPPAVIAITVPAATHATPNPAMSETWWVLLSFIATHPSRFFTRT
ncbi:MAG: hypothetical protein ABI047_03155 [Jatrophihabitantaceae bacterium]